MTGATVHHILMSDIKLTQVHGILLHTFPHSLPTAHAFVQGKMCLAGKELFSVNSHNSSSQTWVGSYNTSATSKLLWKNLQKSMFCAQLELIHKGKLLAHKFCHLLFHKWTGFLVEQTCEIYLRWRGKHKQPVEVTDSASTWWIYLQWCDWRC